MDSKTGLAAALAAIAMAAGIESASAMAYVADTESEISRIESSTSTSDLRGELDALRAANPFDPKVEILTRHLIRLAQVVRTPVDRNTVTDAIPSDGVTAPY